MKRPAFQFYPADWRNNAKLRRCSEAARGVWMDVLCVLHDSDEYGVCRWPLADLARASGAPLRLLKELAEKGVLKGADKSPAPYIYTPRHAGKDGEPVTLVATDSSPCWYSSRFVRDEWVRLRRGSSTQFSPTNQPPKSSPKGGIGERQGDGPTSSSSISSSLRSEDKRSQRSQPAVVQPEGVSDSVWSDFLAIRKAKRSPLTATALQGIEREAAKAGMSLADALGLCCTRGWQGFNAEWVASAPKAAAPVSFAQQDELARRRRWEEMTGRKWPEEGRIVEIQADHVQELLQ